MHFGWPFDRWRSVQQLHPFKIKKTISVGAVVNSLSIQCFSSHFRNNSTHNFSNQHVGRTFWSCLGPKSLRCSYAVVDKPQQTVLWWLEMLACMKEKIQGEEKTEPKLKSCRRLFFYSSPGVFHYVVTNRASWRWVGIIIAPQVFILFAVVYYIHHLSSTFREQAEQES